MNKPKVKKLRPGELKKLNLRFCGPLKHRFTPDSALKSLEQNVRFQRVLAQWQEMLLSEQESIILHLLSSKL